MHNPLLALALALLALLAASAPAAAAAAACAPAPAPTPTSQDYCAVPGTHSCSFELDSGLVFSILDVCGHGHTWDKVTSCGPWPHASWRPDKRSVAAIG
ncbi:hypothetical protein P8C59_004500 [Phyllachora maydis]|uniref:Uncharacterized protein n=1 Tax=Phyllachora maydis TaxID=1825666 RepID=A0AAD9MEG6_9PEZI|nr:hypothetical protein P8C59_004500 [Phyllachora maydis]